MTCSQQALLQRLRFGSIVALTVIVAALVVSGLTIFVALREQQQDAQVLNVVARQRMLSQRLSKAALPTVSAGMRGLGWDRTAELRSTLEQWRAAQHGLLHGDSALGLPGHPTASIRTALLASTPWFETMTEATDAALETSRLERSSSPHQITGDPTRVRQVLPNLLGNAITFTPAGEVVVRADILESSPDGGVLRFEVRDVGIGISPGARPRIFHSFSQGDGSTTRCFGGTGLGLAMRTTRSMARWWAGSCANSDTGSKW